MSEAKVLTLQSTPKLWEESWHNSCSHVSAFSWTYLCTWDHTSSLWPPQIHTVIYHAHLLREVHTTHEYMYKHKDMYTKSPCMHHTQKHIHTAHITHMHTTLSLLTLPVAPTYSPAGPCSQELWMMLRKHLTENWELQIHTDLGTGNQKRRRKCVWGSSTAGYRLEHLLLFKKEWAS